jgi:hypothetical protein
MKNLARRLARLLLRYAGDAGPAVSCADLRRFAEAQERMADHLPAAAEEPTTPTLRRFKMRGGADALGTFAVPLRRLANGEPPDSVTASVDAALRETTGRLRAQRDAEAARRAALTPDPFPVNGQPRRAA